ncbi:aliphatic sulfonate ABC transporter substrate-binding protein [Mesorhizobium sp. M8A.F.Ca.ET.202.01.1.1]|nr:aliphatic sulfonate ABC transporter substrate-binding protein [Mesorhizobium sp. M8A.F.Ca.ET.202.01.1.1]TGR29997.1 aliphatic sulfonate ABC transporter substrate-binding protein [Mesorhizobium sp. M8A.F.Ca.ET.197.01.1.1]TGR47555.1 aliphatic sulfonate ABC transporter substrate-binding protein [bacterium M00.F.Ca.ET.199.01.1.1]TGR55580.1 aliphatic sulfonate ABC transporter substrate-binding protein [Mesorhizobium sp. M8A.F.Ca.ET.198.01.1.1]TGU37009.1 aliphatic sulfonate ABC transporter substrat
MASSAALAAFAASGIQARAAGTPARIGYNGDFWGASISGVAADQGFYAKHGVDADIKVFTNGPIQVQALGANSLEFGYLGPGALWLPATGKAKIIAVNDVGFSDRVIAQAGIKSIAELKGRKVAIAAGTSGDMLLRLALRKANMAMTDLDIVQMDPSTIVAAFASKQVDAAGIWYPFVGIIKTRVPDLVELAKNDDFYPQTTFPSVFIARNDLVEGNPDLVKNVVRAIKDAQDFRAANQDKAVEITSKLLGIPADRLTTEAGYGRFMTSAELIKLTKDGSVNGWFATMNDLFKTFGKLETSLDPKDYYLGDQYISA